MRSQVGQDGFGMPEGIPVPQGGVVETLKVDGGSTREVDLMNEEAVILVENIFELNDQLEELVVDVGVSEIVPERDIRLEVDVLVVEDIDVELDHQLELDVDVGVDENIVELENMLDKRLDSIPEGISLFPSSSSSESGALVQAGASEDVG